MNFLISYNGTSIAAGTSIIDFSQGKITFPDKTSATLTGSNDCVESITVFANAVLTLKLQGDIESSVIIPASRYVKIKHHAEIIKVSGSSAYNLYFTASTVKDSPEIT